MSSYGFVTCFADEDIKEIQGPALIKQSDLKVLVCSYLNKKLHGNCLTFKYGKLESIEKYEESQLVDEPMMYQENMVVPNDEEEFDLTTWCELKKGIRRINRIFTGLTRNGKPVPNVYGVLTYEDEEGNQCCDDGFFSEQFVISGEGRTKVNYFNLSTFESIDHLKALWQSCDNN